MNGQQPGGGYGNFGQPPGGGQGPPGQPGSFGPQGGFTPTGPSPGGYDNQAAPGVDFLAIISLVVGLLGCPLSCCCGFFSLPLSIGAIVLGILSVLRINKEPHRFKGKGIAIAGIVLGGLIVVLMIVGIVFGIGQQMMDRAGIDQPSW